MFELRIKTEFSSAHNLRGYQGQCEALHGHNWYVDVLVKSPVLDSIGLVLDFKVLKSYTNEIIGKLDHVYLNELDEFKAVNPSSENIAKYIFEKLERKLTKHKKVTITKVTVFESLRASASYFNEDQQ